MIEATPPTAALIDRLAADLVPTRRSAARRRFAIGVGSGTVVSLIVVLMLWGVRSDVAAALSTPAFWVKIAFSGALGAGGLATLMKLARPDGVAPRSAALICLVVATMGLLAAFQLAGAPAHLREHLLMGRTAAVCPWLIMTLSVPIFAGSLWAMRAMAPTRLRLAGAAAGLAAGGLSAFVYALSCKESAMPFVFVWYGSPILVMTIIGALVGPRVLRW
jgi:hypothetical protein